MLRIAACSVGLFSFLVFASLAQGQDASSLPAGSTTQRPNILWITSEDNGRFLGAYGFPQARTPHLDRLAREGIVYDNAFANAPVCAPSRSTIITGMYASSLGTIHMRSTYRIPQEIELFPKYLRQIGYFASNCSKTDYNFAPIPRDGWDEIRNGHWRNRRPGQPFFSVFNLTSSHESSLHGSRVEQELLGVDFPLPPYHPDTPEIRSNWVEYVTRIVPRMDAEVGQILKQLEDDGLADDTIVFYYADHAGILPRSKRFLYETGTQVPLIVRFPKKYQHLAPSAPGTRTDRLVSFVDLAPTVLGLAGVEPPRSLQGVAFLGPQAGSPREYVYGFRGRMDERYDMMRSVRDARFRYIRNYLPHYVYGHHLDYLWKMPATVSWEKAFREGRTNAAQSVFWLPKPAEELYDAVADPWEVHNLADNPQYADVLVRMREANRAHCLAVRDAGFLPEPQMVARAGSRTIREMAQDDAIYPLAALLDAAELATRRDPAQFDAIVALLKADDPGLRYWGAVGCAVLGCQAASAIEPLRTVLRDRDPSVRVAAAEAVAVLGYGEEAIPVLDAALRDPDLKVRLMAANTAEFLGPTAKPLLSSLREAAQGKDEYMPRAAGWTVKQLEAL